MIQKDASRVRHLDSITSRVKSAQGMYGRLQMIAETSEGTLVQCSKR